MVPRMSRYFLTGATGFVGGALARRLRHDGHTVVALVRDSARAEALAALGVECREGDITDAETIRPGMAGADGVFHVAGWYRVGVRDGTAAMRVNVDGTRNVLETMRDLGIAKGVYTSTLAVFGDTRGRTCDETHRAVGPWPSEYDRTKALAHQVVAEPMMRAGLPLVIVQPGVIYGPGDASPMGRLLDQYLRGSAPPIPSSAAFCWAHVDDIVTGHVLAMEQGRVGETYIIAGPCHTLIEAFAIAEHVTGVPAPGMQVPRWAAQWTARFTALLAPFFDLPETWHPESLRSGSATYLGSNARAREELGYAPRALEEGFAAVLPERMRELGIERRR